MPNPPELPPSKSVIEEIRRGFAQINDRFSTLEGRIDKLEKRVDGSDPPPDFRKSIRESVNENETDIDVLKAGLITANHKIDKVIELNEQQSKDAFGVGANTVLSQFRKASVKDVIKVVTLLSALAAGLGSIAQNCNGQHTPPQVQGTP